MINDSTKFDKILKTTHELLQVQDLDVLLEHMLSEAKNIVGSDAGSIYLVEDSTLKFSYTQNNTLQNKLPFGKKLIYSTFTIQINNQSIAGYVANTGIGVNIPEAYRIDNFQPYSFDKHFDETTGYRTQSILAVPIKTSGGKVRGVIQLINAINPDKTIRAFTTQEESIVQLFADSASIAIEHAQMIRAMIMRTNKMIELHDPSETVNHANRIAAYSVEIYEVWAHKKGVPEREIQHNRDILRMAAMFHDIGKISVPDSILTKHTNDLTAEETKIKHQHTIYGARLFPNIYSELEEMARSIALNHHENWDGTGYPGHINIDDGLPLPGYEKSPGIAFGKSGLEIPIFSHIVAIANTYDTLTYKFTSGKELNPDKATKDKAVETILAGSGTQFNPDVVVAFASCLDIIDSISERYSNTPKLT